MNLKELREIIAVFEEANISELDLERQGVKIRLKKGVEKTDSLSHVETSVQPVIVEKGKSKEAEDENLVEIKSPMVGTLYRSPSPDVGPFIEEGDEVRKEQVICIIEAMKLMNEIKSETEGRIKKVFVENGQAVEYNQPLFLIEVR